MGASARASILWGGGFTLARDILQFGVMLALVRLLSPSDYGSAAFAQSVVGVMAVASFGTFVLHALQLRDPDDVDWQAHFTAAVVINCILSVGVLAAAWALSFSRHYAEASAPLAVLSIVFLIEIPASLRHRMVQVAHDWKRFRLLLIAGSLLGSALGLTVGVLGGGVWALVVQALALGVPAAVDLLFIAKWRPDWSWSWPRYRATAHFGVSRMASASFSNIKLASEQAILAGVYDFSALGVFTRSIGLATLIAGRIGFVATSSLYPVLTRIEQGSSQFQRYAGLVMRGVTWTTTPAAVFLAIAAADTSILLYGPRWHAVISLLPLAAMSMALNGVSSAVSSLLLANNAVRCCVALDALSSVSGVALAFALAPHGMALYLTALVLNGALLLCLAIVLLVAAGGLSRREIVPAFLPPIIAGAFAAGMVMAMRTAWEPDIRLARLLLEGAVFSVAYVVVLRLGFPAPLRDLLAVAPGGGKAARIMLFDDAPNRPACA